MVGVGADQERGCRAVESQKVVRLLGFTLYLYMTVERQNLYRY